MVVTWDGAAENNPKRFAFKGIWPVLGLADLKNMTALSAGLTVTSTTSENSTTARIRGIGTVGDNVGLESSVGVVIDGVYRPRNGVGFGNLGEIDRIEVLDALRVKAVGAAS
jgi:hypothetical protein